MSKQEHTPWPWLPLLGKLVSAAGNRDASAWDQGAQIADAHTALFNELRKMDQVRAELLEALDGLFGHITARDLISGGELKRRIDLARTAIAKARGES